MSTGRSFQAMVYYVLIASVMSTVKPVASDPAIGRLEVIADGMGVLSNVVNRQDDHARFFVLEKETGRVRIVEHSRLLRDAFLDIGDRLIEGPHHEEGLLGLAFPPDFAVDPRIYLTYIDRDRMLVLSEFSVDQDTDQAIASSERVLLTLERSERKHHCGHIAFGPKDDALYICIGDDQDNYDVDTVSQDLGTWKGTLVRIPLDMLASNRGITDNSSNALEKLSAQIMAFGLRNPWRFAFDRQTGDLFIPDVGRSDVEEVNFLPHGADRANFGWPFAEGNLCMGRHMSGPGQALQPPRLAIVATGTCEGLALSWPIVEYVQDAGSCGVIGGAVYRGALQPEWNGVFVFADLCTGQIWALRNARTEPSLRLILDSDLSPHAIGQSAVGEIVVADSTDAVYALSFPEEFEGGWRSVDGVLFEMMLRQRREGTGLIKERLDWILNSHRWQLANQLSIWYRAVFGLFQ